MSRFLKLTDEQFEKLPKAAREEIERLERIAAQKEKKLTKLIDSMPAEGSRAGEIESLNDKVVVEPYTLGLTFPMNTGVEFGLGNTFIRCDVKDGRLHIYGGRGGTLRIKPASANTIELWMERD